MTFREEELPEKRLAFLWRVLSKEIRLKVLNIISQRESISFNDILTELNFGTKESSQRIQSNQLAYHIKRLLSSGLVQKVPPQDNYSLTKFGRRVLEWSVEVEPSFASHLIKEEGLLGAVAGVAGHIPVEKIPEGRFDLSALYGFLIRIQPFQGIYCNGQKFLLKWRDGISDANLHVFLNGSFDVEVVLLCEKVFSEIPSEPNEVFAKEDEVRKGAVALVETIVSYLRLAVLSLYNVNLDHEPPYSYPLV